MDYRTPTIEVYDQYADIFEQKFEKNFLMFKHASADVFLAAIPGRRVLDLGAGPGHHAAYFRDHGCEVTCVDASQAMVDLCCAKGLTARLGLIETVDDDFAGEMFDAIWAYASLLHIPKSAAPEAMERIARLLPQGGVLGIALKQGDGEGFEIDERYPGQRFFSYYTEDGVRELLSPLFDVVSLRALDVVGKFVFINAIAVRR